MKKLYLKYQELFRYLFFGVCTTLINWVIHFLIAFLFPVVEQDPAWNTAASAFAWICAAIFAFFTYKKWVFEDADWSRSALCKQFVKFIGSRLLTLGTDLLIAYFGTMLLNNWLWFQSLPLIGEHSLIVIKLAQAFVNMVVNYLFSKFVVFRKKKTEKTE